MYDFTDFLSEHPAGPQVEHVLFVFADGCRVDCERVRRRVLFAGCARSCRNRCEVSCVVFVFCASWFEIVLICVDDEPRNAQRNIQSAAQSRTAERFRADWRFIAINFAAFFVSVFCPSSSIKTLCRFNHIVTLI